MELNAWFEHKRGIIDDALREAFPAPEGWPRSLYDAAAWALFGGGKRVRPAMTLAAWEAVGGHGSLRAVLPAACAIEMVHTYSLIHDDLPCMDDDDERRGRPTVHVKFGEALALLAGDALLTEALRLVASRAAYDGTVDDGRIIDVTEALAHAAGWRGMVGGQSIDLGFEHDVVDDASLVQLHRLKTGALFRFSSWAGATLGGADQQRADALAEYGELLGLAFQIADDLLDEEEDQTERGEEAAETPNFPALIGMEASRARAVELSERCVDLLEPFGAPAEALRELARFAVQRSH